MPARAVVRLALALLAAWGAVAAVGLGTGHLHVSSEARPEGDAMIATTPAPLAAAPAPVPTPPVPVHDSPSVLPAPLVRHRVCTTTGSARILRVASAPPAGGAASAPQPRYLVHCGGSVELIGFDTIGARVEPRRLAHFEIRPAEPGLGAEPGGLASGDLDGDGLTDLLIGSVLRDDRETLGGGRIHWARGTPDGSFAAGRRLSDAPAAEISSLHGAVGRATSVLALRTAEARLGNPAQLLWLSLNATPAPVQRLDLGPSAAALASVDIDLDGVDDAFVLTGSPPKLQRVVVDAAGRAATTELALGDTAARELAAGDVDADGHADLVVLGNTLSWLRADSAGSAVAPLAAEPIEGAAARDLQLVDATDDGHVDVVVYAHPVLWLLERTATGSFVARELHRRSNAVLGTQSVRAEQLDQDAALEVLLFGNSADDPTGLDLVVMSDPSAGEPLAPVSQILAEAPLTLQIPLL